MVQDDDTSWIESLAGRGSPEVAAATRREAEALRAGILARQVVESVSVPEIDPARERALLSHAAREGLIPRRATAWGLRGLLLAAAVAGVALTIVYVRPPSPSPETVRSGTGIARLEDADPQALQKTILAELRAAGVTAIGYERLGLYGIDADLPQPIPDAITRVLARHGVPPPADGVLRIEIGTKEGR